MFALSVLLLSLQAVLLDDLCYFQFSSQTIAVLHAAVIALRYRNFTPFRFCTFILSHPETIVNTFSHKILRAGKTPALNLPPLNFSLSFPFAYVFHRVMPADIIIDIETFIIRYFPVNVLYYLICTIFIRE